MAKFNSRTITVSMNSLTKEDSNRYNERETKLKADALEALLVSANPINKNYEFSNEDYEYIAEKREELDFIISNMMDFLREKSAD